MTNHPALDEYEARSGDLREQAGAMRRALEGWLDETGLKLHSVTARVKGRDALARKLSRPDRTYTDLWSVTDVVGLRVTTYFEDSVDVVAGVVERRLPVDFEHSIDKRRQHDASDFGYRSLHYVCGFGELRLGALPARARCEIQIRTVLQHAWAEIEHDLGYKTPDAVPASARRRFSRLASLLEIADQEFVAVRGELEAYAARVAARMAAGTPDLALDRLSLASLLERPEARALDEAIAARLGRPLDRGAFFPDYLLRMLALSGITRVDEALAGLAEHRERIIAMVEPYFAFATTEWKLSPAQMPSLYRGYGLFFLAHVALLQGPLLGISKAERLGHFYRELDYPDDPRAALRIASGLLAALRES